MPMGTTEIARPDVSGRARARRWETVGSWALYSLVYLVVVSYCLSSLFMFAWVLYGSVKPDSEFWANPLGLPRTFQWEHYSIAWNEGQVGTYFFNSVYISIASVAGVLIVSAMAAYVVARIPFRWNQVYLFFAIASMMVPGFLYLIPLYMMAYNLHLTNSHPGLILIYITGSLSFDFFILTGFFKTLPSELEESSALDGSGPFSTFWRVMLPLASPGLLTVAIFNFMGYWNEFFMAFIFLDDPELYTLGVGLAHFSGFGIFRGVRIGVTFAALVIAMVPSLVVFVALQERITTGITLGALKG